MSAFICAECDGFSDADDGCIETRAGHRLICADCLADFPECPGCGEPFDDNGGQFTACAECEKAYK